MKREPLVEPRRTSLLFERVRRGACFLGLLLGLMFPSELWEGDKEMAVLSIEIARVKSLLNPHITTLPYLTFYLEELCPRWLGLTSPPVSECQSRFSFLSSGKR